MKNWLIAFALAAAFVLGLYAHSANRCAADEAYMIHFGEARECVNINEMPR